MAIVSDGHGSPRHFRSDVGSKAAVDVTAGIIEECMGLKGFMDELRDDPEKTMRRITDSIITRWSEYVLEYDGDHPLEESEKKMIEEAGIREDETDKARSVKRYGCTLISCLLSDEAMFAFQIGDGALVAVNDDGEEDMPVPSDEDCFLNRTTSMCGSDASIKFRHLVVMEGVEEASVPGFRAIRIDPKRVSSVTVATDGFTTSFNTDDSLMRYCRSIPGVLATDSGMKGLKDNLTLRSRSNSEDDVSISVVYRKPSAAGSDRPPKKRGRRNRRGNEAVSEERESIIDCIRRHYRRGRSPVQPVDDTRHCDVALRGGRI